MFFRCVLFPPAGKLDSELMMSGSEEATSVVVTVVELPELGCKDRLKSVLFCVATDRTMTSKRCVVRKAPVSAGLPAFLGPCDAERLFHSHGWKPGRF